MLNMMRNISSRALLLNAVLSATLLAGSTAALAAPVTVDLCATTDAMTTLPGTPSVVVLRYAPGTCPAAPPTPPAVVTPGGPIIDVNVGDVVTVNLNNSLTEATGLLFQGQAMVPDTVGALPGTTKSYTFTATSPGTYLYEAALLPNAQHQVAMGLHGALVVRPAATGQAYDSATTAYDAEAVLVLSELDPALNNAASPAAFDMRNFAPRYFMINGQVYPDTVAIAAAPGNKLLLRYVNAGVQHHSMAMLGLRQNFVAKDASLLPTGAQSVVAETLDPGQTGDAIATVSATTADASKFPVYDGSLKLYNNGDGSAFGGMMTFVSVTGTPATTDTIGPLSSGAAVNPFGMLSVSVSDVGRGSVLGSNVTAAEYFLDTTGANGSGLPMVSTDAAGPTRLFTSSAPITGNHTVFVHGMDSANNWGPFTSTTINADTVGPTTSALTLAPNPSNGLVDVNLTGTANDTATGGSNITEAQYQIDGGAAVAMTVSPAGAKIAGLSATIPAATLGALSNGNHMVSVSSRDSAGYWGASVMTTLTVNKTSGPVTSNVIAAPNPNNGTVALSANQPVVRVTATVSCATTCLNVGGAEGFVDTLGANGAGIPFIPADGAWNGQTESVYADIPLSTVAAMSNGNHTIYVHGKEAVGVWGAVGATGSTILVIDKTAPTVSASTLTPAAIGFGTASVTLSVTASDVGTGVTGGQYWVDGSATPPASPTAFTGTSVSVNTSALSGGTHTVYVRVRDAASNWSTVQTVTLTVVQAVADAVAFNANTSATQTFNASTNVNNASNLLNNDLPAGNGRTTTLASGPTRIGGTGAGTIRVTCGNSAITGVCTNGSYRVTLTAVGNNNAARQASKRGTYQFTYTMTRSGVTSAPATVTITVN